MRARRAGERLRAELELTGRTDSESAARGLGLDVVEWPFVTEIEEITLPDLVAVATRLGPEDRRWAVAHAIGHHRLHPGNHLWLRSRTNLASTFEREAEEFAYGFLVDRMEAFRSGAETAQEIATLFGVPEEAVWSHEQMG
jgi:Zn-dependent peptidase ImmA (M78 family)